MATIDGDLQSDCNSELCDLRQKVVNLEEELTDCKNQLLALQKQLNHTEVLYNDAKCCNEELYKQVNDLSEKLHERKKKENNKTDVEIQTDLCFTHEHRDIQKEDLDFHYHLKSDENDEWQVSELSEDSTLALAQSHTQPQTDCSQYSETDSYQCTDYPDESAPPDGSGDHKNGDETTGDSKNISLAESLRVTAEAAMSQTGFMYDESSGLYYDYSTGFYYDSTNQLYYDPNTGIYYYYDAGSGLYQFHSRVDLLTYQTADTEKKVKKKRKGVEKLELKEEKDIEAEISKTSSNCMFWDLKENELPSAEKRKKTKIVAIDQSSSNGLNSNLGLSIQGEEDVEVKLEEEEEAGLVSEPEEGEITDSEKSSFIDEETEESCEGEDEFMNEGHLWPPCIRVMVVRSPVLEPGTLFIITAEKSATIGREKDMGHAIRIAELGVSKFHAEVYFDQDLQKYMLVDKGSQNGTVVNGNRILAVKNKFDPHGLEHGDEVKFGETVLSFHIHPGTETCNGCEPGQVIAHLRLNKKEEAVAVPVLSKEEKDKLRRHELKQIQVKYGLQVNVFKLMSNRLSTVVVLRDAILLLPGPEVLSYKEKLRRLELYSLECKKVLMKNSAYERSKSMKNLIYKDRAAKRRQEIGSDGIFKRDDAPASIHMEICDDNKGRKMLEKMGWKKGEGLGKGSCGIKEPIQVQLHQSQSGLGAKIPLSIEDAQLYSSKNHKNWAKARARFSEVFQQNSSQKEADTKICAKTECKKREPEDSTI